MKVASIPEIRAIPSVTREWEAAGDGAGRQA